LPFLHTHPPPHPLGTIFFAPSKLSFQDPDESGSQSSEEVELVQEEEEKKDM